MSADSLDIIILIYSCLTHVKCVQPCSLSFVNSDTLALASLACQEFPLRLSLHQQLESFSVRRVCRSAASELQQDDVRFSFSLHDWSDQDELRWRCQPVRKWWMLFRSLLIVCLLSHPGCSSGVFELQDFGLQMFRMSLWIWPSSSCW